MFRTPDMGLIVWEQGFDNYNHAQLQSNWQAINDHDHSPSKGRPINTASIAPNAITSGLLAPNSVGEAHIQDNSVDTDDIQDGAITGPKLAAGAASGAISPGSITRGMLDSNLLPLGSVWLWWRQGGGAVPGGGWEVMDGRPWNTIANNLGAGGTSLTTGNIPDMRGSFAQGADPVGSAGPGIGTPGGSNTLAAHTHTITSHTHGMASHTHNIYGDGDHAHTFIGGYTLGTRRNSFINGITINDRFSVQRQNTYWSLYIQGFESSTFAQNAVGLGMPISTLQDVGGFPMDSAPQHSHGGTTGTASGTTGASDGALLTGSNGGASIVPKNVGLLYIMLVR